MRRTCSERSVPEKRAETISDRTSCSGRSLTNSQIMTKRKRTSAKRKRNKLPPFASTFLLKPVLQPILEPLFDGPTQPEQVSKESEVLQLSSPYCRAKQGMELVGSVQEHGDEGDLLNSPGLLGDSEADLFVSDGACQSAASGSRKDSIESVKTEACSSFHRCGTGVRGSVDACVERPTRLCLARSPLSEGATPLTDTCTSELSAEFPTDCGFDCDVDPSDLFFADQALRSAGCDLSSPEQTGLAGRQVHPGPGACHTPAVGPPLTSRSRLTSSNDVSHGATGAVTKRLNFTKNLAMDGRHCPFCMMRGRTCRNCSMDHRKASARRRERHRSSQLNVAFERLRQVMGHVPSEMKLSKHKILKMAILHVRTLQALVSDGDVEEVKEERDSSEETRQETPSCEDNLPDAAQVSGADQ